MFICECDRKAAECFGGAPWLPENEHLPSDRCHWGPGNRVTIWIHASAQNIIILVLFSQVTDEFTEDPWRIRAVTIHHSIPVLNYTCGFCNDDAILSINIFWSDSLISSHMLFTIIFFFLNGHNLNSSYHRGALLWFHRCSGKSDTSSSTASVHSSSPEHSQRLACSVSLNTLISGAAWGYYIIMTSWTK